MARWRRSTVRSVFLAAGLASIGWVPASAQQEPPVPLVLIEATEAPSLIRGCTPAQVITNPGSFTLSRTGPTTDALTVAYTVVGQVAPRGGSATFMFGEALATVPLDPLPDATVLTISVELIDGEDYDLGDPSTATINGAIAVPICDPPEPPEPPAPVVVDPAFAG
jgi:hypothetical protein